MREFEKSLKSRFVNMTPIASQKAFDKNYAVTQVWFLHLTMITRCRYNFAQFENTVPKNKYIEGGKFKETNWALYKVIFYSKQPENKGVAYTVHYDDKSLGIIDMTI